MVSFPLPTSKLTLPTKWPCHRAGADTRRKQAECLFFPAAAELTRPPWQSLAPEDNLMQLTMPSGKSPVGKGEKNCESSLLALG